MPLQSVTRKKRYSPPKLNKLSPEQANLILIGHASCGDQGAKDLLDVLYPPPEPEQNNNVRANFEDEGPAQTKHGTSRLIRRALTALQSTREDFRRFVRG
jgi:hypothetical protein